jgi:CubicO group peptidase (beta-lactamase class C family)
MWLLLACTPDTARPPSTPWPTWDTGSAPAPASQETGDSAPPVETGVWADAFEAVRDAMKKDLRRDYATGAQVSVWLDGEIVFSEGFGTRSPDGDEPVDTETLFQIGSDSKKLTALAVLQQVEAGTMSEEATLAEAVPELQFALDPEMSEAVTLHQLMSQQSGLFDYSPWVDEPDDTMLASRATGRFAENEYAWAPGGSYWSYANSNFSLVGLALEDATGRAYADVMEQDVFGPLGLTRTVARESAAETDGNYAEGTGLILPDGLDFFDPFDDYAWEWGTVDMAASNDSAFLRPAGLIWSTAEDMARVAAFLVDGAEAVLPDEACAKLTTPHIPLYTVYPTLTYGYGVVLQAGIWVGDDYYETPYWAHGGNTMAQTSTLVILPELRFAVTILSNGYADAMSNTVDAAVANFAPLPVATEWTPWPEPADLESFVGTWYDPNVLGTVRLSWDGTDLRVHAPDLEAAGVSVGDTLEPAYLDIFFLELNNYAYQVTFDDGPDGEAHKYLHNRQFAATKVEDGERRPPPRFDPQRVLGTGAWAPPQRLPGL